MSCKSPCDARVRQLSTLGIDLTELGRVVGESEGCDLFHNPGMRSRRVKRSVLYRLGKHDILPAVGSSSEFMPVVLAELAPAVASIALPPVGPSSRPLSMRPGKRESGRCLRRYRSPFPWVRSCTSAI